MWRIADTPLPPTLHEILLRDKDWDAQVAVMRQAQDYFIDRGVTRKETKRAIMGINGGHKNV